MTWVMTGFRRVCKTLLAGFDSLPRLHYLPKFRAEYVIRGGTRIGPFMCSNQWMLVDDQAKIIFGDDLGERRRDMLKSTAWNKAYSPPQNHIHLARAVIAFETQRAEKYKHELIDARKELTKVKRAKISEVMDNG